MRDMVSQIVKDSIAEAKSWFDQKDNPESNPFVCFNMVDGILSNLKSFIHDKDVWEKITLFEEGIHQTFQGKMKEARDALSQDDPLFAWEKGSRYTIELRTWKSGELLKFYDRLSKEHDI